jgi:hypothetical protein
MSAATALALVKRFGLPLGNVTPTWCDAPPPSFRGRHLLSANTSCMGLASLDRFVATFAVISMKTDCRRLASLAGTQVTLGIGRVGKVDPAAVADSGPVRDLRALDAQAAALTRGVMAKNHIRPGTAWPKACR